MWMPWIHRSFKHGILDQPGGHRRLGGGNTGEATATHDNPPCVDNDTAYQIEEDKPNVTCHEDPQPSEKYVLFNKLWVMSSGVLPFQVFCWKFIASSFSSHCVDTDNYKCFAVTFAVEQNLHISACGLQKAKFRMQAMLVKSIWEFCIAR